MKTTRRTLFAALMLALLALLAFTGSALAKGPECKADCKPAVVSHGQGQVDKGNDPTPHVNYGKHKGEGKEKHEKHETQETHIDPPPPAHKTDPIVSPVPPAPIAPIPAVTVDPPAEHTDKASNDDPAEEAPFSYMGGGGIPTCE